MKSGKQSIWCMNNQTELTQRKSSNTIIMYEYEWFDSFVLYSETKLLEYMYVQ